MLDQVALQAAAANLEVHVDPGEHLRIGGRAFGGQLHLASGHVLAALFQNHDDVVGGTAAGSHEHHLHWARCEVPAATFGGAVHGHDVIASGFGQERHAAGPAN